MKCSAFWNHTNIRPGNRVYPCCRFKHSIDTFNGDIENVLHSEAYKELREKSLAGEHIQGCEKCYYEESIQHKSLRQEFNEKYNTNSVELKYLEIGLDNLCNLTCDGCNSEFSTSWIAKEELIYGKASHKKLVVDEITTIPSSVNKILFLGGEPLILNRHLDVLNLHPCPQNCVVIYNTNATYLPTEDCNQVWNNFKQVKFIISIDGVGAVNEKVRGGSVWQDTLNFIDYCKINNYEFEFNTVLHYNNIFHLHDLIKFMENYDNKWYINVLTYPESLRFTKHDRQEIQKYLSRIDGFTYPNKEYIQNFSRGTL